MQEAQKTVSLFTRPRMLSFEEARAEQRRYWAGLTMGERITAAGKLTAQLQRIRGIDPNDRSAESRARFVPFRKR